MKASTTAGSLRKILQTASKATPSSPSILAYSGVQLRVEKGQLYATGSDGNITFTESINVDSATNGEALVLPKPLISWLGTISAGTKIELSVNKAQDLVIKPEKLAAYTFRILVATFPSTIEKDKNLTKINVADFDFAINAIKVSVGKEGVLFVSDAAKNSITLTTTDYYRLTRVKIKETNFGNRSGCVPLSVLEAAAKHTVSEAGMSVKGSFVTLRGPDTAVAGKLLSVNFPVADPLFEAIPDNTITINRPSLAQALKRLEPISNETDLVLELSSKGITASINSVELGAGEETIKASTGAGEDVRLTINLSYLLQAVESHTADNVEFLYSDKSKPVYIKSTSPYETISIVVPTNSV